MRRPTKDFPLRSLLFVPGTNPKMIRKSWTAGPDAIIFDLEDAVPEHGKMQARKNVRQALESVPDRGICPLVRINSTRTQHWELDLKASVRRNLRGIVMPKCESRSEIARVVSIVTQREKALKLPVGSIQILLLIETARGLLQASSMARSSPRVIALIFGAEDFCLDMGITRTPEGQELLYARSHLVTCARAHDCLAVDTVFPDFEDTEGLAREARLSKALGFAGKLAIHPKQVHTIHSAFAPSEDEVSEARRVLKAFAEAEANGKAVVALAGRMVDSPVVQRARQIMALAQVHE
jgi:citrate lyase subunit beta / citryl-CoA lyase